MKKTVSMRKFVNISIPIIFVLGSLFHFVYELLGIEFFGLFFPVNESVWEHLKLVVLPMILVWDIGYFIVKSKGIVEDNKYFASSIVAIITSFVLIPLLFYFYTAGLGVQSMVLVDILIYLVAVIAGQHMALHYYNYGKGWNFVVSIIIQMLFLVLMMYFTVYPPKLPIFTPPV